MEFSYTHEIGKHQKRDAERERKKAPDPFVELEPHFCERKYVKKN